MLLIVDLMLIYLPRAAIFGYMADKMASRQWSLIAGLVALGAATSLFCAGTSLGLWIAGRILQGLSAAVVWTVGLALLVDTVAEDELGAAMGFMGMGLSAGTVLGPLVAGVVYQRAGYYAVFAVAFALIGVDIVLRLIMIEKKDAQKWLSTTEETASSEQQSTHQITKDGEGQSGSYAAAPTPEKSAEMPREEPQESPSKRRLPATLILLSNRRMMVALYAYLAISIVMTSFESVLPLFVQGLFGWEQIGQGLIFIPLLLPHFLEPLIGLVIDRYQNSVRFLAAGAFFFATPVYVLLRFVTDDSIRHKVLLCALLALIGLGYATILPSLMTEVSYIINSIEEESPNVFGPGGAVAQGYGIFNSAFAAGSLVGPVWGGFIRDRYGWGTMSWSLGLLSGVTAVLVLLTLGGWIGNVKKRPTSGESRHVDAA